MAKTPANPESSARAACFQGSGLDRSPRRPTRRWCGYTCSWEIVSGPSFCSNRYAVTALAHEGASACLLPLFPSPYGKNKTPGRGSKVIRRHRSIYLSLLFFRPIVRTSLRHTVMLSHIPSRIEGQTVYPYDSLSPRRRTSRLATNLWRLIWRLIPHETSVQETSYKRECR